MWKLPTNKVTRTQDAQFEMPSPEVAPVVSLWGTVELLLARVARLSSRLSPIALILQLLSFGLHVCVTISMERVT